ncbi:hypothetical protein QUF63_00765 [Anaerolineales bacterium HSG25]|nr:hypothetical protein [Anaerolineales bacterium HSG25]
MRKKYNLDKIRELLHNEFTRQELLIFCYDDDAFHPCYQHVAQYTELNFVDGMLEHAKTHDLFETLTTWALNGLESATASS